jgi:hypothetical protein
MSLDSRLSALLDRWQQSRDRGQPLSPEELCRDCPELRPQVERQIAVLAGVRRLARNPLLLQANAEEVCPPTALPRSADDLSLTLPPLDGAGQAPCISGYEIQGDPGHGGMGVVQERGSRTSTAPSRCR